MNNTILIIFSLLLAFAAHSSDSAKEQRWADQIIDSLIDGDEIWLETGKPLHNKFLGIYTESNQTSKNTVIIMHGLGIHPNWQQVIQPLRVGLVDYGWNTLSIQMPILKNGAKITDYSPLYEEANPRIRAAIQYLKESGHTTIIIVSHSLGASMAAYYLTQPNPDIIGFVGIGMTAGGSDTRMDDANSMRNIHIPILDLYGSEDLSGVLSTSPMRANAAKKANNTQYSQIRINGANHFFDGKDKSLVTAVAKWLASFKH